MEAREDQNQDVVAVTVRILIPRTDVSNIPDILRQVRESLQEHYEADISLSTMRPRELRR